MVSASRCADPQQQGWDRQALGTFDVELVWAGQLCLQHADIISHCFPRKRTASPHPWADPPAQPSTALLRGHKSDPMPDKWTRMEFHPPTSSYLGPTAEATQGVSQG